MGLREIHSYSKPYVLGGAAAPFGQAAEKESGKALHLLLQRPLQVGELPQDSTSSAHSVRQRRAKALSAALTSVSGPTPRVPTRLQIPSAMSGSTRP